MNDHSEQALEEYRRDCEVQGLSKITISHYQYCLKDYSTFLEERNVRYDSITINDVIDYITYLRNEKGFKASTLEYHFTALNSFYDYRVFVGKTTTNIIPALRKRYLKRYKKQEKTVARRKILTPNQMADFLSSIMNPRDKAIATLLVKTGIRRNELISINLQDINWQDSSLTLKDTRKRSNSVVFFDPECAKVLRQWVNIRESIFVRQDCDALFVGSHGGRLRRKGVYDAVTGWAKQKGYYNTNSDANVDHFSPHNLRHCFTTYLLENGMMREYVKELRGDARKDAVDLYNHIPAESLREAYLAAMPQFGL